MSRRGERRRRAAARPGDRVQVDVVRHLAVRMIVQVKLDEVAFADADETAGHIAAERPEEILDAIGDPLDDFLHFEIHDDLGGVLARDGRRHERRRGQHGLFFTNDVGRVRLGPGGRLGRFHRWWEHRKRAEYETEPDGQEALLPAGDE